MQGRALSRRNEQGISLGGTDEPAASNVFSVTQDRSSDEGTDDDPLYGVNATVTVFGTQQEVDRSDESGGFRSRADEQGSEERYVQGITDCESDDAVARVSLDVDNHVETQAGRTGRGQGQGSSLVSPSSMLPRRKYVSEKRVRQQRGDGRMASKRMKKADDLSEKDVNEMFCCDKRECIRNVDIQYLLAQVRRTAEMNREGRRVFLQGMLQSNMRLFVFNNRAVCSRFLELTFGFSRDMQGSVKRNPLSRIRKGIYRAPTDSQTAQRDAVICFLERLADSTADIMPDSQEKHLPFPQKSQVYKLFLEEFTKIHARDPPSHGYFHQVWKKHVPHIKVRKVHRFAKCNTCEAITRQLAITGTNEKKSEELRLQRRVHLRMIASERREYQKKCEKAILYPNTFCSFIIDGADQSAFGLPHFTTNVKDTRGHSIDVKLIGVLEHGPTKHLSLFTMTGEFETGANHIIEALHRALTVKWMKGSLPGTLFLQVDNCSRENKNRFFFSYVEALVGWGVFEEVYVSFLPVGHTHADIDQAFSCTARRLRNYDAITMDELILEMGRSYTPTPTVTAMRSIPNFSGLCKQEKVLNATRAFSKFRYFRFHRVDGPGRSPTESFRTGCSVRVGCDDDWEPLVLTGENKGFLTNVPELNQTPPTPAVSPDNIEEITKRLVSEETRIGSRKKLISLRALRDRIYETRSELFHWDVIQCLEYNGRHSKILNRESMVSEDREEIDNDDVDNPRDDFEYEVNEFVAVRCRDGEDNADPFWIGKIITVEYNHGNVACRLLVQWYEVGFNTSPWNGKYAPSKFGSGARKGDLWQQYVEVSAVLVKFSNLTKTGRLSVRDGKKIQESINMG